MIRLLTQDVIRNPPTICLVTSQGCAGNKISAISFILDAKNATVKKINETLHRILILVSLMTASGEYVIQ
jgi:hypothetical protein